MSAPKPGQHGEPWTDVPRYAEIRSAPNDDLILEALGVTLEDAANCKRAAECVNALDGRDPAALAGLIEAAQDAVHALLTGSISMADQVAEDLTAALAAFGVKQ